ncbi:hypothetical protein PHLGIDRAFT_468918 [Phlebiopsis gigantea 11061_1 CR5-6]|uniref:Lysophospholipase n=1 Tax=Phlebiopsis gigantea (strain 11061_1 CR5-6) TaxID=745531 RepID=A0A0C3S6E2_PHLG1|nr:hypothetical protein PHLGIDRAFT_468918 [Phlebiopsis gigantea 11061_1 CR5-6]
MSPLWRTSALVFLAILLSPHALTAAQLTPAGIAYTPQVSACPSGTSLVRSTGMTHQNLSQGEEGYVSSRQAKVLPAAWSTYLANVEHSAAQQHTSLPAYVKEVLSCAGDRPTLGIATSGGGHRAAFFGAGVLNALDGRNATSVGAGTGGLLQTASYLSGLSGGSWLLTSLVQAGFPTIPSLIFGLNAGGANSFGGFLTQFDLFQVSNNTIVENEFLETLLGEVSGKAAEGFHVTIADVWARTLSRHFVNGTTAANFLDPNFTHGAGETFSSLVNLPIFQAHQIPFPIVIGDTLSTHENDSTIVTGDEVPLSNPIYEFNVFEFGSFDPMLASFIPMSMLGSHGATCVTGFDQTAFVAGVSSNLWSEFNTSAAALQASEIGPIIDVINATFPQSGIRLDSAIVPNPFVGVAPTTYLDSSETQIALVDGGIDGQVIPIQPLLVKARDVDVIVAIDASADTEDNFTDGASLIATQDRVNLFPTAYSFPPVPATAAGFTAANLTKRPTFFGCNTSTSAPLLIYIANGGAPLGQVPQTNVSTFTDTFSASTIQGFLDQTFDIATQGIAVGDEKDPEWPVCLACAVVDRARARKGVDRSGACVGCLQRYCAS